jgi:hypothetical protein
MVLGQISTNEAKQSVARIVGLVFTLLGAGLLLVANLFADGRFPSATKRDGGLEAAVGAGALSLDRLVGEHR